MFSSLSQMTAVPELSKLNIETSITNPGGVNYPLTSGSCTFAVVTDTNGVTYDEVHVSLTYAQMQNLGLVPTTPQPGKACIDDGSSDPTAASNLTDSQAFMALMPEQARGQSTQYGDLNSTPPNSPGFDKSFVQAAGCEIITATFGGASSPKRQIMNQASDFYLSVEGYHSTGVITAASVAHSIAVRPSDVTNYWNQNLSTVIIAGCAVLDINDYNNNYTGAAHTSSPGKLWAASGVDTMLGYNYYAPVDNPNGTQIIKQWCGLINGGNISGDDAWGIANENGLAWNACAIINSEGYYYFEDINVLGITVDHVWTKVPEPANGW
jgi:hypothetical protein